jgi:hypothetical protein
MLRRWPSHREGSWSRWRRTTLAAAGVASLVAVSGFVGAGPAAGGPLEPGGGGTTAETAVVRQWYDITSDTVTAAAFPEPVTQSRTWSVSWLAAAQAVRAGEGPVFGEAALVQALHDTLVAQVPSRTSALDASLTTSLAGLPDGWAKDLGVSTGRSRAAAVLAQRAGDGLDPASVDVAWTPPAAAPGVWQPTPPTFGPAIRAGQGGAKAFILKANNQFDPGPPPALNSSRYLTSLAEVHAVGAVNSSVRTAAQTDVATFWEPATNVQYVQILRDVLATTSRSLAWEATFVAAFNIATTDAQIGIYNAKYEYVFWRPVTAIRTGTVDPDPTWTPFFASPRHPEYPSGHLGFAGAAQAVLTAFLGPNAPAPVSATSPADPGVTHTWTSWAQITDEVSNARVWEGVHFRFSDQTAARVGYRIGDYDADHLAAVGLDD